MALSQNPIVTHDMGRLQLRGCRYHDGVFVKDDVYTSVHLEEFRSKHAIQNLVAEELRGAKRW